MMRQAGRHMKVYRDLVAKWFRERSEIPEAALRPPCALPRVRCGRRDIILRHPHAATGHGRRFQISEGGAISIPPIRTEADLAKFRARVNLMPRRRAVCGRVLGKLREEVGNKATVLGFVGLPFT